MNLRFYFFLTKFVKKKFVIFLYNKYFYFYIIFLKRLHKFNHYFSFRFLSKIYQINLKNNNEIFYLNFNFPDEDDYCKIEKFCNYMINIIKIKKGFKKRLLLWAITPRMATKKSFIITNYYLLFYLKKFVYFNFFFKSYKLFKYNNHFIIIYTINKFFINYYLKEKIIYINIKIIIIKLLIYFYYKNIKLINIKKTLYIKLK